MIANSKSESRTTNLIGVLLFLGMTISIVVVISLLGNTFISDFKFSNTQGKFAVELPFPLWHHPMLADEKRNVAFQKAIESVITEDSVVLDLGTGTGLLAMMAVQAGAKYVYAIEREPMIADMAKEIIELNGFSKKISLISKDSSEVILPEKANVYISETFDDTFLGEGFLNSLEFAKRNFLLEDAILIPSSAAIIFQIVEWPWYNKKHEKQKYFVSNFDLTPLNDNFRKSYTYNTHLQNYRYKKLSDPFIGYYFDFYLENSTKPGTMKSNVVIKERGTMHAVTMWWKLQVDQSNYITTGPKTTTHWCQNLMILDWDIVLEAGDVLEISISHDMNKWTFSGKLINIQKSNL